MKSIAAVLGFILLLQVTIWSPVAQAAQLNYTPRVSSGQGSMDAEIPCNKVGSLLADDLMTIIHGNTISVTGKTKDSKTSHELLTGLLLSETVHSTGKHATITGTAYFEGGPGIDSLVAGGTAAEIIDTTTGEHISGHITSFNHDQVTIDKTDGGQSTIPIDSIKTIHSPKYFNFSVSAKTDSTIVAESAFSTADATITFSPGTAVATAEVKTLKVQETKHHSESNSGHTSTRTKILVTIVMLALIATAIAVPVAIAVGSHGGHSGSSMANQQALFNFLAQRNRGGVAAAGP